MTIKKRGLGRGLDALLGTAAATSTRENALQMLDIDQIERGQYQPRVDFDQQTLQELAHSIGTQGVMQPIMIRPRTGTDRYEIIAGERRWRAAQLAGLQQVPVVIKDVPDHAAMCMALIENIQREDLKPLETAYALERLIEEFDMTHQEAAKAIGCSRSMISNLLRLLELHDTVKEMLNRGELEMGHARALLSLNMPEQLTAAQIVAQQKLSVRETEAHIRALRNKPCAQQKKQATKKDPNTARLEDRLAEILGAKVIIKQADKGNGIVQICYNSLDELEGILAHIK